MGFMWCSDLTQALCTRLNLALYALTAETADYKKLRRACSTYVYQATMHLKCRISMMAKISPNTKMANYVCKFTSIVSSICAALVTVVEKYQNLVLRINEVRFTGYLQLRKIPPFQPGV